MEPDWEGQVYAGIGSVAGGVWPAEALAERSGDGGRPGRRPMRAAEVERSGGVVHDGVDGVDPDGRDRIELVQHLCQNGRLDEALALLDDDWVRSAGSLGYLLRAEA